MNQARKYIHMKENKLEMEIYSIYKNESNAIRYSKKTNEPQ